MHFLPKPGPDETKQSTELKFFECIPVTEGDVIACLLSTFRQSTQLCLKQISGSFPWYTIVGETSLNVEITSVMKAFKLSSQEMADGNIQKRIDNTSRPQPHLIIASRGQKRCFSYIRTRTYLLLEPQIKTGA